MQIGPPRPRRRRTENIVPMINVVFLLLIFFLMSAQIAPPEPFDVTPPGSDAAGDAPGRDVLYVAADGELSYGGLTGDAAISSIAARDATGPLDLRADAALPATVLAALLPKLAAAGVTATRLVTGDR
ncbi:biopolymer transporter ExbD [Sulfitobacter sabulilitoris]|uniref:Biopolymer transporter ExbD n=2 Tax=Sulfitobacter sabulilitoris TaxID=2562655 RepID=A0A5S3PMR0_9RHOB|nr:biopolymer transporter ExbD [Sulfitobacter sabulilitoris]TMM55556.1 biopolymer transporter ExbD [Sulfitobacter sabulilitoris]